MKTSNQESYDEGYEEGLKEGDCNAEKLQEAYDKGYAVGIAAGIEEAVKALNDFLDERTGKLLTDRLFQQDVVNARLREIKIISEFISSLKDKVKK